LKRRYFGSQSFGFGRKMEFFWKEDGETWGIFGWKVTSRFCEVGSGRRGLAFSGGSLFGDFPEVFYTSFIFLFSCNFFFFSSFSLVFLWFGAVNF